MVLFLMSIKFKDTDYLQKKQFTFKNESSEESKKKKERELLSKFPLSYRGAGSLTIIEVYPTISRSSQTSYIGMNRCSTASLGFRIIA